MKHAVIISVMASIVAFGALAPVPGVAQPFNYWSTAIGASGADQPGAIVIDPDGNVYVTGAFYGAIDLGGGPLVSAGDRDIFLVKYAPDGTHLWSKRFGGVNADIPRGLDVDDYGDVALCGSFYGSINFGGGTFNTAGTADPFYAVFDSNGTHKWSGAGGGTGSDHCYSIAFDASGGAVVTGSFQNTINLGGSNLVSAGQTDIFIARYSPNGSHQWSQRFGGTSSDSGNEIAVDSAGYIVFGGVTAGTVDLGGGNLVSAGQGDIILARFDASGVHQWSQRFGDTTSDSMENLEVGPGDDICFTGSFGGTVDFGGGNLVSAGSSDIVFARFTSGGAHVWSHGFGNTNYDRGYGVGFLPSGNTVFTGRFQISVDFGGGTRVDLGNGDVFIVEFDGTGAYVSDSHYGTSGLEYGTDLAADDSGGYAITGWLDDPLDFGSGAVTSAGDYDVFVARLKEGVEAPAIESIVDVGNDEGRVVQIAFDASAHDDAASTTQVLSYEIYRRDDAAPSFATRKGGGPLAIPGWTYVASAPAHGEDSYNILASTIGDSTIVGGPYESAFFVRAATSVPTVFYDSPPDSGYSLDNLAPPAPSSVVLDAGMLTWDESPAADVDYFSVYGSNVDDFDSAVPLGQSATTGIDVTGSPYAYYFVTATDFAGNEGDPGATETATGVGPTPAARKLSLAAHPNPFNPSTTIAFTVPAGGRVHLRVYDARGAHVTTLVDGVAYDAGEYTVPWNGRNSAGNSIGSGVYFVRIDQGGSSRTQKIVLLK